MTGTNSKQLKPVERVGLRMEGPEGLSLDDPSRTGCQCPVALAPLLCLLFACGLLHRPGKMGIPGVCGT